MRNNKMSAGDVLKVVESFTKQSENNVAFGVLAETKYGRIAAFVKGEESDILTLLTLQMSRDKNFKELLFKAVAIYKFAPVQKIIEKYEQEYEQD